MIKLTKGPEPDVLVRLGPEWTATLLDRALAGVPATEAERGRYRHTDIKEALKAETFGKCAYCESKLLHISYGDIEHIVPKSVRPEFAFTWENLTLACDICNTNKGHQFGNHDDLVDPYVVDPATEFLFLGPLVLPVPGDDSALKTEMTLKLNRAELVERRTEHIQKLRMEIEALARIVDADLREVVRRDIIERGTESAREYAGTARAALQVFLARIGDAMA